MDYAIETHDLTKIFWFWKGWGRFFEPLTAVDQVSLNVPKNRIFVLLGPNGAGKTTLIKLLGGLIFASRGEGKVFSVDLKDHERVKAHIGLVNSDNRSFYGRLSALENLKFYAKLHLLPNAVIKSRIGNLLDQMGLDGQVARPVQALSSGMKQRLAIARALVHDPPLLFFDEPTKSLDPFAAREFRLFLKRELVERRGKTLFVVTHHVKEAEEIADDVAIMVQGKIMVQGSSQDIARQFDSMEEFMSASVGGLRSPHFFNMPFAGNE